MVSVSRRSIWLATELRNAGINVDDTIHTDKLPLNHEDSFNSELLPNDDVRAVVVGFNCRINYRVLAYAHHILHRKPENLFIATNSDAQYPAAGKLWPGKHEIFFYVNKTKIHYCIRNWSVGCSIIGKREEERYRKNKQTNKHVLHSVVVKEKLLFWENRIHCWLIWSIQSLDWIDSERWWLAIEFRPTSCSDWMLAWKLA